MRSSELAVMVAEHAAVRRRRRLQPAGGPGETIFPPTYPGEGRNSGPQHVFERRRVPGHDDAVWCVLVDSVQSQANRLEDCLQQAIRDGIVTIPHVVVDFAGKGLAGLTEITSLEAPHRIYDAILRDSLLGGVPFMESEVGKSLALGEPNRILEISPTALLFGAWHSTGQGGGIGAKFPRCIVSEIVAVNTCVDVEKDGRTEKLTVRSAGRRTSSRIDPLGILSKVEVYKGDRGWDITKQGAANKQKQVKPSEINHGNIKPSFQALGVTCDYIEHSFVISFAALRRLRFGSPEKDRSGRNLLAALGLLSVMEQDARGYALRSRCDLVCEGSAPLECVHPDGNTTQLDLDLATARSIYAEAFNEAEKVGFALEKVPLRLQPQDKLVSIVRQSQELALQGAGGEAEEEQ